MNPLLIVAGIFLIVALFNLGGKSDETFPKVDGNSSSDIPNRQQGGGHQLHHRSGLRKTLAKRDAKGHFIKEKKGESKTRGDAGGNSDNHAVGVEPIRSGDGSEPVVPKEQ